MNSLKVLVIAITLGLGGCGQSQSTNKVAENVSKPAQAQTPAAGPANDVASGKELYAVNCQACHRDTGKGGKITIEGKKLEPEDLTSDKMKKHDDGKLLEFISDGVPDEGMPSFKNKLSAEQIKAIIKHIRSLQAGPPVTS